MLSLLFVITRQHCGRLFLASRRRLLLWTLKWSLIFFQIYLFFCLSNITITMKLKRVKENYFSNFSTFVILTETSYGMMIWTVSCVKKTHNIQSRMAYFGTALRSCKDNWTKGLQQINLLGQKNWPPKGTQTSAEFYLQMPWSSCWLTLFKLRAI